MRSKFCPWLAYALGELGESEIVGDKDNPRIVEYHQTTSLSADDDETPWCASFVSWCLEQSGTPSKKSARARDYLTFGKQISPPQIGAIAVMVREGGGHVGFYWGEAGNGRVKILGGNQGNKVSIKEFDGNRVISYRWPL